MALKSYATQDEVPEALRPEYVEKDGRWIPDVADAEDLYASGLKRSQQELLADLKKAQAKLKAYDGVDPEEHKKLKDAADKAAADAAKATGNWEAREKQLVEQSTKETAGLKASNEQKQKFIEKLLVENALRKELEPVALSVDLLLPPASKSVRVVEKDGEYQAVVVDGKGNERIRDAQGNPFTIADLVKEMSGIEKYAPAFKGTQSSGSGARGSGGQQQGAGKTIQATDTAAFISNLEGIATGKVTVAG